jgi:hypothetical protein
MSADYVSFEVVIKRSIAPVWRSARWWPVLLDGHDVGQLASGESLVFQVPLGPHAVVVGPVGPWRVRSAPFQFDAQAGGRIELVTMGMPITAKAVRLTRAWTRTPEAEIVIEREASADLSMVSWRVLLDGHDVGRLANGKSLVLRVPPGSHALVAGPANRISGRLSVPFQFHAHAGGRIELVTQAAAHALGVWCSAVSAQGAGTGVAVAAEEGPQYELPLGDEVRVIDNSKSSSATTRIVRLTREWTRTTAVDLERATTIQGSAEVNLRILDLKAETERALTEKYSRTINESNTFEEQVTLNVAPRTRCRVIFSWKEIRQKGVVQLAGGDSQVRIPYEVVVGITFDQQQIDDQAPLCRAGPFPRQDSQFEQASGCPRPSAGPAAGPSRSYARPACGAAAGDADP